MRYEYVSLTNIPKCGAARNGLMSSSHYNTITKCEHSIFGEHALKKHAAADSEDSEEGGGLTLTLSRDTNYDINAKRAVSAIC